MKAQYLISIMFKKPGANCFRPLLQLSQPPSPYRASFTFDLIQAVYWINPLNELIRYDWSRRVDKQVGGKLVERV